MVKDKFTIRIQKQKENIKKFNKMYNMITRIRFIIILASIYFTYMTVKTNYNKIYLGISCILYILFVFLIINHRKVKYNINICEEMVNINERYLDRINGNWIDFKDIGEEFIDSKHKYSSDLDILGKGSLFQLINTTNTWSGRESLAQSLLNENHNKEEIKSRQEVIKELSDKLDFCEELEFLSGKHKEKIKNPEKLIEYANSKEKLIKSQSIKKLIYYMPIVTIPLCFAIIIFKIKVIYMLIPILVIIQSLIWGINMVKTNNILASLGQFKYNLDTYLDILNLLQQQDLKSKKMKEIKNTLFNGNKSALVGIKKLDKISQKIELRYNGVLYIVLNILFLWDYQCIFLLEDWKSSYGYEVEKWIKAIGEVESLMSLSVLMHINENVSFPNINNSKLQVKAENLAHPLISNDKRVANDVDINDNIFIITGSNMSGKTTFLRTIGINLVLAYCGAPVCASSMSCAILDIFTSMRIADDLKHGISTFYAELIRIKDIIDYANKKNNMIFFIDEIFTGTNSIDRILGAKNVVANLDKLGAIGAITTHDLELCNLDKYNRVKNYNFCEYYKDNKIFFDYKIKEGKSKSTNAKYLMNIVGIKLLDE